MAFLEADRTKAFSLLEIYAHVEGYDEQVVTLVLLAASPDERTRALEPYREVLRHLEEQGQVRTASYRGADYYAAVE